MEGSGKLLTTSCRCFIGIKKNIYIYIYIWYPLNRRLGVYQSTYECGNKIRKPMPPTGINELKI
jgi:hypothetical protein